jgi:DNA-binding response OmpR family regulator
MLTAKTLVSDRVAGLDAGADDYLCKPFSSTELKAKLRVYQRRAAGENSPLINAGGVTMDTVSRTVTINDQSVKFTPTEYRLLEYLITHPNRLITRTMIKEHVWGGENDRESNIINVYMERLRSKLGCRPGGGLIETVRGEGYRLNRL